MHRLHSHWAEQNTNWRTSFGPPFDVNVKLDGYCWNLTPKSAIRASGTPYSAQRGTADPGSLQTHDVGKVPGLQRNTFVLRCARDTLALMALHRVPDVVVSSAPYSSFSVVK